MHTKQISSILIAEQGSNPTRRLVIPARLTSRARGAGRTGDLRSGIGAGHHSASRQSRSVPAEEEYSLEVGPVVVLGVLSAFPVFQQWSAELVDYVFSHFVPSAARAIE